MPWIFDYDPIIVQELLERSGAWKDGDEKYLPSELPVSLRVWRKVPVHIFFGEYDGKAIYYGNYAPPWVPWRDGPFAVGEFLPEREFHTFPAYRPNDFRYADPSARYSVWPNRTSPHQRYPVDVHHGELLRRDGGSG
jgi:hypothetical protein